ncbi:MAG: DUF4130 domain-containing protein [Promethearchaeota archaeon]
MKRESHKLRKNFIDGYSKEQILKLIQHHKDYNPILLKRLAEIPDSILNAHASYNAKKIHKMICEMMREFERTKQFTRTSLNGKGVIYAKIAIEHHIEDWVLEYFHNRFPEFYICLFNTKKHQTISISEAGAISIKKSPLEQVVLEISENRPIQPYFDEIEIDNQTLYDNFYSSQFIKTRENRRYFKQMIPDKVMKLPGMKGGIEARFRSKSLDNYI